jgi:ergothioneine biosynthesis protein EgtB
MYDIHVGRGVAASDELNSSQTGDWTMRTVTLPVPAANLAARFRTIRQHTLKLVEPLTPEDMMVQSTPEASPAKWHLAHTAWFFDSFILREFQPSYRPFDADFAWLFNSYYRSFAAFPEKRLRSSFSRPPLEAILRYRAHVDAAIEQLIEGGAPPEALTRIELGLNHEEQHQELLLTDILHAFYTNPLRPAYQSGAPEDGHAEAAPLTFLSFAGGIHETGHTGAGFCFDNELPRHRVWLEPFAIASRLVTCGEYAEFIADGGYRRPELWLSAGWDTVEREGWTAPLYWTHSECGWTFFTLCGEQLMARMAAAPVSHVSYYEADAYARWAGKRLATEFEWEVAAEGRPIEGNLLESGRLVPFPATALVRDQGPAQQFGDCWEWTASAYLGYPGFRALPGSLGEYNGKFMSGLMVLRGGSCVSPAAHIRASYRNFFAPETRWQLSGIRLAE